MKKCYLRKICILLVAVIMLLISPKQIKAAETPTVFVMGDSKTAYYTGKDFPREGWVKHLVAIFNNGQYVLPEKPQEYEKYEKVVRYVLPDMTVENWSRSDETVKRFEKSGRFEAMINQVQEGDYVMITLGHNDARKTVGESVSQYKSYLTKFVQRIKAKKARIIMVTTPPRNYKSKKKFQIHAAPYRKAMMQVAGKYRLSCIDLDRECVNYFNYRGKKYANMWYMKLKPHKYTNYPKGLDDPTHFTGKGAKVIARIAAVQIQNDRKQQFLGSHIRLNTRKLYRTWRRAKRYHNRKRYTKKSWKKMVRMRNRAWKVLYSPNAADGECIHAEKSLRKAMKGLKKHG